MNRSVLGLSALVLLFASSGASAQTFQLKNGETITAEVKREADDFYIIRGKDGSNVVLLKSKLANIPPKAAEPEPAIEPSYAEPSPSYSEPVPAPEPPPAPIEPVSEEPYGRSIDADPPPAAEPPPAPKPAVSEETRSWPAEQEETPYEELPPPAPAAKAPEPEPEPTPASEPLGQRPSKPGVVDSPELPSLSEDQPPALEEPPALEPEPVSAPEPVQPPAAELAPEKPSKPLWANPEKPAPKSERDGAALVSATYQWTDGVKNYEKAMVIQKATKSPFILYFYTNWSPECKKFKKQTLNNPLVKKTLEPAVKVSINSDVEKKLAAQYGVKDVPALYLVFPDGSSTRVRTDLEANSMLSEMEGMGLAIKAP